MPFGIADDLSFLFANLKDKTTFKISGDGSKILYPLFITDMVHGLLKAMFSQGSKGKVYSLAGKETSILEFVNVLKKVSKRTLGIEFSPRKKQKKDPLKKRTVKETKKQLNWRPKVSFEKGIKKTLDWFVQPPPKPKHRAKINFKRILLIFIFFLILIIGPLMPLAYYYFLGVEQTIELADSFKSHDLAGIEAQSHLTKTSLEKGKKSLLNLFPAFSFLRLEKQADKFLSFFDMGIHLSKTADLTLEIAKQADKLAEIVIRGSEGDINSEIEQLGFYLDELWNELSVMETVGVSQEIEKMKKQAPFTRAKIDLSRKFLKILPQFLAIEDKRTYLVLLQNNLELRPTGGFIGSYGLLTFEKGQLLDFQILESSAADSQLKGQTEPPTQLKKYLGEKSWYFRDANWNPHFPDSGAKAEWFLEKGTNRKVEGTIALNFNFVKKLLKILGPVELEKSGESITSNNLFERAEYYSIKKEGTKDFLGQVVTAIFIKAKQIKEMEWFKLSQAVNQGLEEKELLFSLYDKKPAVFFNKRGWDGAIRKTAFQETLLTDYLMIVEANLSANKVNYFIDREITQEINILNTGEIEEKTTLVYQNNSPSEKQPGGSYKNYLRLYLPLQSKIFSVKIGKDQQSLESLSFTKIDLFEEHDKQVIGFFIEIPIQERWIVEVNYRLANKFVFDKELFSYAFYWQKQPGVMEDDFTFQINYPREFKLVEVVPEAKVSDGQVFFETTTLKDRLFLITFNK